MNEIKIRDTENGVTGWIPESYWENIKAAMSGEFSYFPFTLRLDGELSKFYRCIAGPGERFIVVD